MSEWKECKLGDVAEIVGGGTPKTKVPEYWNGEIPWLTPRDLSNFSGRYISKGERNISKSGLKKSSAKILPKGAILLSSRAPVGYLAIALNEITTNQGFRSLIPNSKTDSLFLYYLLKNNVDYLKSQATGTTFGELAGSTLKSLSFLFPPLPEQRAIASILTSLDDKIELNRQMNSTLESIGQALFKHWFVDFEFPNEEGKPYKSSGGEMVESELGEVPLGWRVGKLGDYIKFVKGKKPNEVSEKKIEGYLPQILIETLDGGNFSYAEPTNLVTCSENDIIMVMDGASSGRVELGFSGIIGSTLAKIVFNNEVLNQFYLYLILLGMQQEIKENTTGSAIPHTDKKMILFMDIVIPEQKVLIKLQEIAKDLFNQIWLNKKEIKSLSQIRDTLLPKLMSGEIRVKQDDAVS